MKDRLNARLGTNMGYFRSRVRELLENDKELFKARVLAKNSTMSLAYNRQLIPSLWLGSDNLGP